MKHALDVAELQRTLPPSDSLFALLAFEREGDMVRAARSLGLSQPALSFQLKKLEESVGFPIFSFAGKRKVLTQLGQAYVEQIQEAYLAIHLSHKRISREAMELDRQKLRVAGRRELFIPFLPFPFPGQIEFIQSSSTEALKALREHRVDLAISAQSVDSGDLLARLFFESGFKLIYPRAWGSDLDRGVQLKTRPVVVYGNHHAYLGDYLKWQGWRFQELQVSRIVEDWFSVVELVRAGFGWAIIPEGWGLHTREVLSQTLTEKLTENFQDEFIPRQKIFLFHRRDDRKAPWLGRLEEWLRQREGSGFPGA
jgi:DNA-binding transcriptional LysR family regulator